MFFCVLASNSLTASADNRSASKKPQKVSAEKIKMYRWENDDADSMIFSDIRPSDQADRRIEALNKNAQVVAVIEKEKTPAQKALYRHFLKLRKQQQAVIDQQKEKDDALLRNFHNTQELELALQDKMSSFDIQINVVKRNLDRLNTQLNQQQNFAAQFEKDGKKVPRKTAKDIASSKAQLKSTQSDISTRLTQKENMRQEYQKNMARLTFLTQSRINSQKHTFNTTIGVKNESELGVYTCTSALLCDKAWGLAKQFINTHSTTSLYLETNELIMSQDPSKKTDMSLSVSKENLSTSKQQLFLDMRCHLSSLGKERCGSLEAQNIRYSFNSFIQSGLTTH